MYCKILQEVRTMKTQHDTTCQKIPKSKLRIPIPTYQNCAKCQIFGFLTQITGQRWGVLIFLVKYSSNKNINDVK